MKIYFIVIFHLLINFNFLLNSVVSSDKDCKDVASESASLQLKRYLTCDYDTDVRPVPVTGNVTEIVLIMYLQHLNFDQYSHEFSMHNWLILKWTDSHLTWNPSDFNGITKLAIGSNEIWIPDIAILNGISNYPVLSNFIQCDIYNVGNVVCLVPNTQEARCVADLYNWPYQEQNCRIVFSSWSKTGEEMSFKFEKHGGIDLNGYQINTEWQLINVTAIYHPGHYPCCPNQTFPSIEYKFKLKHHSAIHVAATIVPALTLLSLNLIAALLSAQSTLRIGLCAINMLFHIMFLQSMVEHIISNSDNCPAIILFYRDSMIITIFNLIISLIVHKLFEINSSAPTRLDQTMSFILSTKLGQIFLLHSLNPEDIAMALENKNEDSGNLVSTENIGNKYNKNWRLFGILLDKITFLLYTILYAIFVMRLLPN